MKRKEITFLSAVIFIIGSTVGAGIFFKSSEILKLSQGDFILAMVAWFIGISAIVLMALSLVEVSSADNSNRGILGWSKIFVSRRLHNVNVNYYNYIFLPITLVTMPIYCISTLEDAGMVLKNANYVILCSFAIFMWFMIVNLISFRFAEISQWIFTAIQTIPLVFLPLWALFSPSESSGLNHLVEQYANKASGFLGSSKYLVLIAGIPAIAFTFDGFYLIANNKNDLNAKAKTKLGLILVLGITIVSFLYIFLSSTFSLGSSDGTHNGLNIDPRFIKFFNVCIAVGIMGIVNGFVLSGLKQVHALNEEKKFKVYDFIEKFVHNKMLRNVKNKETNIFKYLPSWLFLFVLTSLFFVLLGIPGANFYTIDNYGVDVYGTGAYFYTFTDVIVNFTSLLVFIIIQLAITGAIINRWKNKVEVHRKRYFLVCATLSNLMFYAAIIFFFVASVIDMTGLITNDTDFIISSVIKFAILIIIIFLSILPEIINKVFTKIRAKKQLA
ncbi:amino acid permease [Mycoplasmopsis alligatoris]|uniref:Amino acid permease n=1 Tax=Mycoplasmopsis alligatoris A21JP2 TaxID=747682 RepID=D4XW82_9BACT|nr:amino acid permease [Mycoplasmopsis alligatoris]EFF41387.1 amino acid permease [Mycoplasmopsis alligatoris A21JP2]